MAEEAAQGKMHDVDNKEADAVIKAASHQILHNEAIGRVIRNMYMRIEALEQEVAIQKKVKRSVSP
jgi:hypothetical protein